MSAFVGTAALVRLILRRERIALPVWVLLLTLFVVGTAAGLGRVYPTPEALGLFARQINGTPGEVALLGRVFAPTLGGLTAWRVGTSGALLAGLMSILTVVRHTRGEEEAGRREWLASAVVGRLAPLTAALLVALGANLALAALVALGLVALGLNAVSSLALGGALAASGPLFAMVAGASAQLSVSARGAILIASGVLGAAYLVRIVGDAGVPGLAWLSWASPLGWTRFARPFAGEAWGVFALIGLATAGLGAAAYGWSARRDLGAGLLGSRLGPPTASPGLSSPLGLAWRLQRGLLLAWTLAFAVLGAALGGIASAAAEQLGAAGSLVDSLAPGTAARPVDVLLTISLTIFGGELLAIYAIEAALGPSAEEASGRADPVLSTPVGRVRWAASQLMFALLGPAVVLAAFGLGAGLTLGLSSGEVWREVGRLLLAALVYLPAVWVLVGITTALFGWWPRRVALGWGALVLVGLIDLGSELLGLTGSFVTQLSPFTHVPKTLLGQGSTTPLAWLAGMAALLVGVGLIGFRHRDVG